MSEQHKQSANEESHKTPKTVFWVFRFIVFAILAFYFNIVRLEHLLANKIADLRKNNCPTNSDELSIWYLNGGRFPKKGETPATIDDKDNAAIPFKEAFALLVSDVPATKNDELEGCVVDDGKLAMSHLICVGFFPVQKYLTTPLPKSVITTSEAYLKANCAAMLKINEGLKRPNCYHHELKNVASIGRILSPRRSLIRLFRLKSKLAFEAGKTKKGVKIIQDAVKFITKFKAEPFVIYWLINNDCSSMIYDDVEWMLNKTTLNDEQLSEIAKSLNEIDSANNLIDALKTEPVFIFLPEYDNSTVGDLVVKVTRSYTTSKEFIPFVTGFTNVTGISIDIKLAAIDVNNTCIEASKHTYPVATKMIKKAHKELSYKNGVIYGMKDLLSSLGRAIVSKATFLAEKRITLTAIAIERYRLAHKKLPDSLSELVPEFMESIPIDPFNGKQIYYKKCDITHDQAVKMTKPEIKKHPGDESSDSTFGKVFAFSNIPNKTEKNVEDI